MTRLLLVSDLDGTLTFNGRRPHRAVLDALALCERTDGVRLVLATARSPRCLRRWFGSQAARMDLVCCNGAFHVGPDGVRTRRSLEPWVMDRIVPRLDVAGVGWCAEYGDHFVASSRDALPWMGQRDRRVRRRSERPRLDGVLKLCVDRADPGLSIAQDIGEVTALRHATGDGDIVAAGVDKWVPVASLRGAARVSAFGNDLNDARLLASADRAVVVGEGLPDLDERPHVTRVAADPLIVAAALRGALRSTTGADDQVRQQLVPTT